MARQGLHQHRKFLRLALRLESTALARGALEMLWEPAYDSGDDFLGDADDIEARCGWASPRGVLATALVESGFVDPIENQPSKFAIHDLFDHMPDAVARRLAKEMERLARGKTLKQLRSEAGRKGGLAKASKRLALASEPLAKRTTPPPPPPLKDLFAGEPASLEKKAPKKEKDPDPRHTPIKALLATAFWQITGTAYGFQGGKDAKGIEALLAICPDDGEILFRWKEAWSRSGYDRPKDIPDFVSKWNLYALPRKAQAEVARFDPNQGILGARP